MQELVNRLNTHGQHLTATEATQWQRDGYFIRHQQFSNQELEKLRQAAARATAKVLQSSNAGKTYFLDNKRFVDIDCATVQYEHYPGANEVRVLEPVHWFDAHFDSLADDPRLVAPMQGLIDQQQLALWTTKLNLKPAGGSAFGWHQDSPYWIHDCAYVDQLPNVMLTLDPQSKDNGCFRIIRGSHTRGILPGTNDGSQLGGFYTDPTQFDEQQQVLMEVDAGALIFFSPHSVHGSAPNTSESPRRALIFTYQPGDCPMLKNGQIRNVTG